MIRRFAHTPHTSRHSAIDEIGSVKPSRVLIQQRGERDPQQEIEILTRTNQRLGRQMSRLKQAVIRVRHLADHDKLTGLPNRRMLLDRLGQAFIRARRADKQVALVLMDLDGFKAINDQFGHAGGDELLRQVAARLSTCVRAGDTICRYGGDEFVIVMPDIGKSKTVALSRAVAQKIKDCLMTPFLIDGTFVAVTASQGISVHRQPGGGTAALIAKADAAMYRAKRTSRAMLG